MRKRKPPKTASLRYEKELFLYGYQTMVGIDEAGRGAWAGPVTAGAVCLPKPTQDLTSRLAGVRDSKQMTALQREKLVDTIKSEALAWGVGSASNQEIDRLGIVPATHLAMIRALEHLQSQFPKITPDCLLLDSMDWNDCPFDYHQKHIKKGDQNSLSIAAASVLAKTWRDAWMRELSEEIPQYGFANHKGYGTAFHQKVLNEIGASPFHRRSFAPVRMVIERG